MSSCANVCLSMPVFYFSLAHPVLSYSGYIIYHHYYIHLNSMKREKVDLGRWGCGEDLGIETRVYYIKIFV